MHDASAKLTSGILNGNVNQYGDFDQCLSATTKSNNFKSQYCLAHIQPKVSPNFEYLNYLRTLSLSFEAYKSEFKDVSRWTLSPFTSQLELNSISTWNLSAWNWVNIQTLLFAFKPSHVIPKTSQIHWALCVPSTCTFKEVEFVLHEKLKNFFNTSNLQLDVQVRENMCQVKADENSSLDFGTKAAMWVAIFI